MTSYIRKSMLALAMLAPAASAGTVWEIGKSDNSTAEFAHAPGNFRAYKKAAFFIVGQSDAKKDWSYVQPGTIGNWVPGSPQKNEIHFALDRSVKGKSELVLDFVDTHSTYPCKLKVELNGKSWVFEIPKGAGDGSIMGDPSKGREHVIRIPVPAKLLKKGNNKLSVTTLNGAWVLWDSLRLESDAKVKTVAVDSVIQVNSIKSENFLVWHEKKPAHEIEIELQCIGKAKGEVQLKVNGKVQPLQLQNGHQKISAYLPAVKTNTAVKVELFKNGKVIAEKKLTLAPVRRWELNLVHQTHLDIGFTHTQEDVLKLQVQHLHKAMELIEKTKNYPEGSRFIWHPEGMWAVEEYMRTATEEQKKKFIEACRNKQIHIDALYAQAMTGMYTEEELMQLVSSAKNFARKYDIPLNSAMQSDVPGYTWGLASVLAHNGIKYLSVGPNWFANGGAADYFKGAKIVGRSHRGGHVLAWGDKPFWWVDPSGKNKVLFWMPGWGYSGFHANRGSLGKDKVKHYLDYLSDKAYPYDIVMWRYGIGADNGPPRADLSDVVKAWNEKYASPRLVITSNSEVMERFAERYGKELPVVKGDFTPYWEDGSISTSRATAANREASEKASQAENMWSMLAPEKKLHDKFNTAWHKMIMYDEHTWGANCSISAPDSAFSVRQDEYKQKYAFDGLRLSKELISEVSKEVSKEVSTAGSAYFDVYNTSSWDRSQLITLSAEQSKAGDRVVDASGKALPSQRLADGSLAFRAEKVPAFGARRFQVVKGKALNRGSVKINEKGISNDSISLGIDAASGTINSLRHKDIAAELVDARQAPGLNDFLRIIGRNADQGRSTNSGSTKVTVEDAGPLVATLRIESTAPGCKSLIRRVRLVDGEDAVELINTLDKIKELKPETVFFGFPFNIPGAESTLDAPWATVKVEKQQIVGANRNFYCVQRWLDVSNKDYGITWVTLDSPMMQFNPIKIAHAFGAQHYRTRIEPGAYIHSWVMNNHWECNFKAYQKGKMTFRYLLKPHKGAYDAVKAQRFGRESCRPLLAISANKNKEVVKPLLKLAKQNGILITSIRPTEDGKAYLVRLFNSSEQTQENNLKWQRGVSEGLFSGPSSWVSNPQGDKLSKAPSTLKMGKHEVMTIRVKR